MKGQIKVFHRSTGNLMDQSDGNTEKCDSTHQKALPLGFHMQSVSCTKESHPEKTDEKEKTPGDSLKINLVDCKRPGVI